MCPQLAGELRYAVLPHRLPGEPASSNANFLAVVAAYGDSERPTVLVDSNQDHRLDCTEELPLLSHPKRPGFAFRTLEVSWRGEAGATTRRRYRLSLPERLQDPLADQLSLEMVEVPVARWSRDGRETLWVLYDGNFDSRYDRSFGDGLFIDLTGERHIDTRPQSEDFFSLHLPLVLPWGTWEVRELDPEGRFLTLARLPDSVAETLEPLGPGSFVDALECRDPDDRTVHVAGASGRYQLLYFWLSHCGSCEADLQELAALLPTLERGRWWMVGVSLDEEAATFRDFATRHAGVGTHCFLGTTLWDNAIARRFGVVAPSDFVVVDPRGRILFQDRGIEALRRALGELHADPKGSLVLDPPNRP